MKDLGNWKQSSGMSSAIVSDKRVNDNVNSEEEVKAYGGYLVAESVFNEDLRKLIIESPEMYKLLDYFNCVLRDYPIWECLDEKIKDKMEEVLEDIEGDDND